MLLSKVNIEYKDGKYTRITSLPKDYTRIGYVQLEPEELVKLEPDFIYQYLEFSCGPQKYLQYSTCANYTKFKYF